MASLFKENKGEIRTVTNVDILLMIEKGIRGGICHAIHRYAKGNDKYMMDYNKDEEESFLEYLDTKNLCGWAMSEPLPIDGFDWIIDLSKINEDFMKAMIKIVIKDIFLK